MSENMRNTSGKKILAFWGALLFIIMSFSPILLIARADEVGELYHYRGIFERSLDQKAFDNDLLNRSPSSLAQLPSVVTLTFDDGYENIYENAFPILKNHHMHASLFMITGRNEFEGSALMNLSELLNLQSNGWNIDPHTVTHPVLTELNFSEITYEVNESKNWVINNKLGDPVAFSYPYGKSNVQVRNVVSKYYYYARTMKPGLNNLNFSKNLMLTTYALWGTRNIGSLELCKRKVTKAMNEGKWIIITIHGVVNDSTYYKTSTFGWTTTDVLNNFVSFLKKEWTTTDVLNDFVSFLQNKSANVKTFSELINST